MHQSIIVEGPIGVGKSSLSKRLAKTFGFSIVLEKPEENPFLKQFYQDSMRYALSTQLSFLMQRAQQLVELKNSESFHEGWVSDYMIHKDPIFAELVLNQAELQLYKQIYNKVDVPSIVPDLMICLQAPENILLDRIKKRNIDSEANISREYLTALNDCYTQYFYHYDSSPLLIVNAAEINPVDNDIHYNTLVEQICRIESGRHYFNPLA